MRWLTFLDTGRTPPKPDPPPVGDPIPPHPLARPAWVVGFLLGLIGLVDVVRLILDVLT